jgi:hypothetical protein
MVNWTMVTLADIGEMKKAAGDIGDAFLGLDCERRGYRKAYAVPAADCGRPGAPGCIP